MKTIALVKYQCAEPKAEGPELKVKRNVTCTAKIIILHLHGVKHIYIFSLQF